MAKPKKKPDGASESSSAGAFDERFARIGFDPRFKTIPKKTRKVAIDNRFKHMFTDDRFKSKRAVDKRGRAISSSTADDMRKFYKISDSEGEGDTSSDEDALDPLHRVAKNKSGHEDALTTVAGEKGTPRAMAKKKLKKKKRNQEAACAEECERDDMQESIELQEKARVKKSKRRKKKLVDSAISSGEEKESSPELDIVIGDEENTVDESSDGENGRFGEDDDSSDSGEESSGNGIVDLSARARGEYLSSSSDDEDVIMIGEPGEEITHQWAALDEDAPQSEEVSERLAVCNMDWDRIGAKDLMVLFSSFVPKGGLIKSVTIYPSEYGLERMAREDAEGPKELVEDDDSDGGGNAEGSQYSMEKLRQYQISRLKYYYAVVDCESAATASAIYEQCDGREFEMSQSRVDLRFVPSDMTFDQEAKEFVGSDALAGYKPPSFFTSALQQSKVSLTWDETDVSRVQTTMRKFTKDDIEAMDFSTYLASESSESSEDDSDFAANSSKHKYDDPLSKYKALVGEITAKEEDEANEEDMEITFEPGLKESVTNLVRRKTDEIKKKETSKDQTVWEDYLKKKKAKRKERKRQAKQDKESDEDHYSGEESEGDLDDDDYLVSEKRQGGKVKAKKKKSSVRTVEEEQELEELKLLVVDDAEEKRHFSMESIMKKESLEGKKKKKWRKRRHQDDDNDEAGTDTFKMDLSDPRFEGLYTSHQFAIDPSNPQFKKTKSMDSIMAERQRRRVAQEADSGSLASKEDKGEERHENFGLLVKSVKNKAAGFKKKRKN